MNIGQVAAGSGISAKMIRYYERVGLLPPAARSESGYRVYTPADVHKLGFIRRARDLGFSIAEIGGLLDLWNDRSRRSADVKQLAEQHVADLEQRMEDLRQMARTLKVLIHSCAGDDRPDCPILQGLEQDCASTKPGDDGGRSRKARAFRAARS